MNGGVGSSGSPSPKSKRRFPAAASARRRSSSSTMRFFWTAPSAGFRGVSCTGKANLIELRGETHYKATCMLHYDVVVIGSGPAGENGAVQAALSGKKVALVEKEAVPGGAAANT